MASLRWLNPSVWAWSLYFLYRVIALTWGMRDCEACDFGDRGEIVPFDNLCDEHQTQWRAALGEDIDVWWEQYLE